MPESQSPLAHTDCWHITCASPWRHSIQRRNLFVTCGSLLSAGCQLIGLLKYVRGSIWGSLGRMFSSPVCSIVTVEKECEGVDVALHEVVQWAQGYFILIILEVFCNSNDSVILYI